jgi:hypothetical protein
MHSLHFEFAILHLIFYYDIKKFKNILNTDK